MKKWMITYSLLTFFAGMYLSGHSGVVSTRSQFCTGLPVINERKISFGENTAGDAHENYQRIRVSPRSAAPVIPLFFLAERFYEVPGALYCQQQPVATAKKEIIRDRLLHLFPFHFFW
jgi:hypothetical protein